MVFPTLRREIDLPEEKIFRRGNHVNPTATRGLRGEGEGKGTLVIL